MIPKHCIEKFEKIYEEYPSFYSDVFKSEVFEKLVNNKPKLWVVKDEGILKEGLSVYDKTGIYIYYKLNSNNGMYYITFVTKIDKIQIIEFELNRIKKK